MSLLEAYKKKNEDRSWYESFSSLAKGKTGRLFEYTNTNFRTQSSFLNQFQSFEKIEGKERSEWNLVESHGQERDKQRVVNMLASKLFKRDPKGGEEEKNYIYSKTEKGKLYNAFLQQTEFSETEQWILNYIFLLNGYYANKQRYILSRTIQLAEIFLSLGIERKELMKLIAEVIGRPHNIFELLRKDFFYLHSFYADTEFVELYLRASSEEKEELALYIDTNLRAQNDLCCISKKYKAAGNFNSAMFLDESKVLYFSLLLADKKEIETEQIIDLLLKIYNSFFPIDELKVFNFVVAHSNIFYVIFGEILGKESRIEILEKVPESKEVGPQVYIDDTTLEGARLAKQIFSSKKKRAREMSNFRCSLEKLNNCRYFTSKSYNDRYIEVHHLIPQEFRNEFAYSIEVFANYVTLCAHCHELLHKSIDNEKTPLLNYLFNERKERLDGMNLKVELGKLYEFYKMD